MIAATGVLHHPAYPNIEGIDSFAGIKCHSARWDHSVPLEDKKVGVIGSGSSAIQIGREHPEKMQEIREQQQIFDMAFPPRL